MVTSASLNLVYLFGKSRDNLKISILKWPINRVFMETEGTESIDWQPKLCLSIFDQIGSSAKGLGDIQGL